MGKNRGYFINSESSEYEYLCRNCGIIMDHDVRSNLQLGLEMYFRYT